MQNAHDLIYAPVDSLPNLGPARDKVLHELREALLGDPTHWASGDSGPLTLHWWWVRMMKVYRPYVYEKTKDQSYLALCQAISDLFPARGSQGHWLKEFGRHSDTTYADVMSVLHQAIHIDNLAHPI